LWVRPPFTKDGMFLAMDKTNDRENKIESTQNRLSTRRKVQRGTSTR
jgi:hypothetical protein